MISRHVRLPLSLLAVLLASSAVGFVAARLLTLSDGQTARAANATVEAQKGSDDPRLAKSYRFNRGGWIYVHLEGSPHDIGFQHGYLLADEIADAFSAVNLEMTHTTDRSEERRVGKECW